jgi:CheY-like chemotaxis protein
MLDTKRKWIGGPGREGDGPHRTRSVLVAEDEPLVRQALEGVLEARGHRVQSVASAPQAIRAIERRLPDAAVVDWKMPGGGEAILWELLGRMDFQGPVILVSGALGSDLPREFEGRVARLHKPFSFSQVAHLVETG